MTDTHKRIKKKCSIITVLCMIFTVSMPTSSAAATISDTKDHWASETIQNWQEERYITGYPDGSFRPNDNISRAEFMTLVNKAFDYTATTEISFSDVKGTDWYFNVVAVAQEAGYISGYGDGTIKSNNPIAREEAATIITKINKLQGNSAAAKVFSDSESMSWSKDNVGATVSANIMKGYPDGSFRPHNFITRAEAVIALDKALSYSKNNVAYDRAGVYGPETGILETGSNVIIAADGITLQNMTIKGNLTVAKSVGDGNVTLDNVTVEGETLIYGGGQNSVVIIDSTLGNVTVFKENGKIRIVISGSTTVGQVTANSGVKLEETNLTDSSAGFQEIILDASENDIIVLIGSFTTVSVNAEGMTINVPKGTKIDSLVLDKKAEITGTGTITRANVNASGVTFETAPKGMTVAAGITKPTIGASGVAGVSSTTGGGGGGGGGGGDNTSTPADRTALVSAISAANAKLSSAVEGTAVGQYAAGSKATFQTAINAALAVSNDSASTQTQINQAVTALTEAESRFDAAKVTSIDKTILISAISAANTKHDAAEEGIAIGKYADGSKAIFKTAIDAAQAVAENIGATQTQINQAVIALAEAENEFDAAKVTTINKTAIISAISAAGIKCNTATEGTETGMYSVGSKATFQAAIVAAQGVADTATDLAQINQAVINLEAAESVFDEAEIAAAKLLFTFDDGYNDNLTIAAPSLEAVGFKGTAYINEDDTDGGQLDIMRKAEVNQLYDFGWDIGNHSKGHERITAAGIVNSYKDNQEWLISNGWTRGAYHVAYAYGERNDALISELIKMGCKTGRLAYYGMEEMPPDDYYLLYSQPAGGGNLATVKNEIDAAVSSGASIVILIHKIRDASTDDETISTADFKELVDYVKAYSSNGEIDVETISEWYNENHDEIAWSLAASKRVVTAEPYIMNQGDAISEGAVKARVENIVDNIILSGSGVKATVKTINYMEAVAGTTSAGIDGTYQFTVELTNGTSSVVTDTLTMTIKATSYQTLTGAAIAVESVLTDYTATNSTTKENILASVNTVIINKSITAAFTGAFAKTEADIGTPGSIKGEITLTDSAASEAAIVAVNIIIPALEDPTPSLTGVAITGSHKVDAILTATPAFSGSGGTATYEWYRAVNNAINTASDTIIGTNNTYKLGTEDKDFYIYCVATGSGSTTGGSQNSNIVGPVTGLAGVKLLFTFDDGYIDDLTNAAPILTAAGFKATAYITEDWVAASSGGNMMTIADIGKLYDDYGWDIGNHSRTHIDALTGSDVVANYQHCLNWLESNNWERGKYHAAYPNGSRTYELIAGLLKLGYRTGRLAYGVEFQNYNGVQSMPVNDYFLIVAQDVGNNNLSLLKDKIKTAVETAKSGSRSTIVLMLHKVRDGSGYTDTISKADFQELVTYVKDYVSDGAIEVQTISEWYEDEYDPALGSLTASNSLVCGETYVMSQAEAESEGDAASEGVVKEKIDNIVKNLILSGSGVTADVAKVSYSGAVSGNIDNYVGTNGAFTFTVDLKNGTETYPKSTHTMTITATEYTTPSTIALTIVKTADSTATGGAVSGGGLTADPIVKAQTLSEAQNAAETVLAGFTAVNDTTEENILDAVRAVITNDNIDSVFTVFDKTVATVVSTGSIKGTVELTDIVASETAIVAVNLIIIALPPSSEASLTSTMWTVDNVQETITGITNGTTLEVFKETITSADGATFEVYDADGITEATDLLSGCKVIVTAQDGKTIKAYTVTIL